VGIIIEESQSLTQSGHRGTLFGIRSRGLGAVLRCACTRVAGESRRRCEAARLKRHRLAAELAGKTSFSLGRRRAVTPARRQGSRRPVRLYLRTDSCCRRGTARSGRSAYQAAPCWGHSRRARCRPFLTLGIVAASPDPSRTYVEVGDRLLQGIERPRCGELHCQGACTPR